MTAEASREPEHIEMLRDTLRRFIAQEMPRQAAREWDRKEHFPREVFKKLAALGVMGLTIPEEYGGSGRDILATMATIEELSRRSLAVSVPYVMAACYAGMNLVECGSEAQKREMLPKVAAGELIFAYGWSEPDTGADVASVKTTATREGDSVIVNGAKRFCSGADICDYIFTVVKSNRTAPRYKNMAVVLIPPNTPGVTIRQIDSMGVKGANTTDVTFDNVKVPFANVLGGDEGWDNGWKIIAGSGLDVEKLEVAAIALGIAEGAFADAWDYAEQRMQFGKPVSTYQAIRHKLADMATQLHACRLMMRHASELANQRIPCGVETSMTKLYISEAAKTIALDGQTIMGAYGYAGEFDMERYVRDALAMPIIGGSSAIQRNNIVNWKRLRRE
jgi:alkylation response protein AidB-like acyl-CoA dehydrogenase